MSTISSRCVPPLVSELEGSRAEVDPRLEQLPVEERLVRGGAGLGGLVDDVEQLHRGEVEAEHRRQMRARISQMVKDDPSALPELQAGYECARVSFHTFFQNIYDHIDATLHATAVPVAVSP